MRPTRSDRRPETEIDRKYGLKHERYLAVLEKMMREDITDRSKAAKTYKEAFNALRRRGLYGDFTAMQHLTDLNYSPTINFSEDDFIVAGPGALDGLQKCFVNFGRQPEVAAEIIRRFVERQEGFFADVGLKSVRLFGQRRLTLIRSKISGWIG
jgi:5-hmdU DNA kinase-like protein